jgi:hypothetical protein
LSASDTPGSTPPTIPDPGGVAEPQIYFAGHARPTFGRSRRSVEADVRSRPTFGFNFELLIPEKGSTQKKGQPIAWFGFSEE